LGETTGGLGERGGMTKGLSSSWETGWEDVRSNRHWEDRKLKNKSPILSLKAAFQPGVVRGAVIWNMSCKEM
jgi:hypothetical protein